MPSPRERLVSKRAKLARLADDPAATPFEASAARERMARIDAQLAQFAEAPPERPAATTARTSYAWGWMHVEVYPAEAYGQPTWNWTAANGAAG